MSVMIALVGEQPLPNFLPVIHCQPDIVMLVYTSRTRFVYQYLKVVLEKRHFLVYGVETDPYHIVKITERLQEKIEEFSGFAGQHLTFNLTGGTKPMSHAAYQVAKSLQAPVIYLESEKGKSAIDYYSWQNGQLLYQKQEELSEEYLSLDDMLTLHLGPKRDEMGIVNWEVKGPTVVNDTYGHLFELAIAQVMRDAGYEVLCGLKGRGNQLDIDVIIGYQNQVGIIEAKTSQTDKINNLDGVKQISYAMSYLRGTYIRRFLVIAGKPSHDLAMMCDEVLKIPLVALSDYRRGKDAVSLSQNDKDVLLNAVNKIMQMI